jgi:hypothetical protein
MTKKNSLESSAKLTPLKCKEKPLKQAIPEPLARR